MDDELEHLLRGRDRDDIEKVLELLRSLHTKRHNGTPGVRNAGHNLARPLVEEADDNDLPLTQLGIPIQERFRTAAESRANGMPEESSAECASLTRAPMPNALTDSVVLAQLTGGVDGSPRKDSRTKKSAPKKDITPAHSLTSFGFFSSAVKAQEGNKLFSPFIQDKRIVPQSLQFWEVDRVDEEGTPIQHDPVDLLSVDEESSLMHPPIHPVEENEVVPITAQRKCSSFNEAIEASMKKSSNVYDAVQAAQCPCAYHSTIANPYDCFDGEVIFCGFYAVGYDPCQARPPYYGTFNHREGETTIDEVVATGRPACGVAVRRFAHVDYDYDSGDDWDVLEGDEDIAASSSGDSESHDDDSLDSSDDDFINDSNDGSDSDCEVQRKTMEARQRRMSRLRGKDKLLPSFSGPFTGIASEAHPLRFYDRLDRLAPLDGAFFDQVLQAELNPLSCPDSADAPDFNLMDNNCDAKVMEAALKNRRQMTDYEISAMKLIINNNSNISVKMVVKALQQQQMCIGVPLMVATRTIKRFFERRHGMLIERAEPWAVDDDRLFKKRKTTELGVPSQATLDFDADDENNTPTNCVSSSSAAAPAAVVEGMDAVCSEGNALNAMGETIEIGVKRPRDSPDDHDGG